MGEFMVYLLISGVCVWVGWIIKVNRRGKLSLDMSVKGIGLTKLVVNIRNVVFFSYIYVLP